MAFDGAFLHKTVSELKEACDSHIDKIYQPSKDELVFLLRKKDFCKRLLISVKQGSARIQFTENKYENPKSPPMFCMLMRKYLSSAKLIDVSQPEFERIAVFTFTASNEMGDIIELRLIAEFIGSKTNIILAGQDGRIIDSLRHSDPEISERLVLPGAQYTFPEKKRKNNPLDDSVIKLYGEKITAEENPVGVLLDGIDGFSPLVCREAVYRAEILKDGYKALKSIAEDIKSNSKPLLLLKEDGSPYDFSYTDISQYGGKFKKQQFGSFSELLDAFYTKRDNAERIHKAAADILKLTNNIKSRTEKKLAARLLELKKCENREQLRIYGELLKANLYRAEPGARFIEAENYYEDMKPIRIPLDPALSPQQNAAKYFKDYKKTYTAEQTLTKLTEEDRKELIYLDSVLDSISRSESLSEIAEIREELTAAGYIKRPRERKKNTQAPGFREYTCREGYKILVGKNNRQNDYITTVLASKNDLWFHVKNIPGSHVIVMCHGESVSDETLKKAAMLAAKNSKASSSSQVPVDYTPVKYVKKPNGAKPGMVIYTTNKTVYVTPSELSDGRTEGA